jgi:hypothetical protein
MSRRRVLLAAALGLAAMASSVGAEAVRSRATYFIGVDISRSFLEGPLYEDALGFLAHYIDAHLRGLGGLERPNALFVGPIGGHTADEAKTLYPMDIFEGKTVEQINAKLHELFPKGDRNPTTDFSAFFEQVAATVRGRNLLLRPMTVVLVSDGKPYVKEKGGSLSFERINVQPLEKLARNVTLRLLYTDAVTAKSWQTQVKRRNVKLWTQDAEVMAYWKDPGIFLPGKPLENQEKFHKWIKDNVDFGVKVRRVY